MEKLFGNGMLTRLKKYNKKMLRDPIVRFKVLWKMHMNIKAILRFDNAVL